MVSIDLGTGKNILVSETPQEPRAFGNKTKEGRRNGTKGSIHSSKGDAVGDLEQNMDADFEEDYDQAFLAKAKWVVLALSCWIGMAANYCYDNPSATHEFLRSHFDTPGQSMNFESFFNLLYSVFSIPNIIFPLIVGMMGAILGDVFVSNLSMLLLIIASVGVALGVQIRSETLMLCCRAVYGLGLEGVSVTQTSLLVTWFSGKHKKESRVALALGLLSSSGRFGSVVNNFLTPTIAGSMGLLASYYTTCIFNATAFFAGLVQWRLEKRRCSRIVKTESDVTASSPSVLDIVRSLTKLPKEFWAIVIIAALFYGIFFGANNVSQAFVVERLCGETCCGTGNSIDSCPTGKAAIEKASYLMSIPAIVSISLSIFVGLALDRYGRMLFVMSFSVLLLCLAFGLFAISSVPLPLAFVLEGLSVVVFCTMIWPTMSRAATGSISVAIGVTICAQNLVLSLYPLVVAAVREAAGNYLAVQYLFLVTSVVTAVMSIALWFWDYKYNGSAIDKAEKKLA
uniref:Lysosomal dipeptide transporter MFSD1 n=1 Tax=Mucochytrium quahogii TaxID=96639 RepID=A0A7S2S9R4_9STRA|mmetsp:Transcript_2774/g.5926  ORF Transcript_2774/g.5926 Transcript_2774/m.5926 type:complete len:512 (+) Transcript_2774:957-2492(+)